MIKRRENMRFWDIVWEYRFVLAVAAGVIIFALFEWQKFKTIAYSLMLQAKRLAKDAILNSGAQQEEWVVRKAYQFLPRSITVFISEERMKLIVHFLYTKAKDYMDDGEFNDSISKL
jgi:hypothetical protein